MNNVHERPAGDGLPAVIGIIDSDKGKAALLSLYSELYDEIDNKDPQIAISSGEETEGEYEVGMVRDGQGTPPLFSDEEGDDEDSDDDNTLSDCEDSGNESVTEDDSDSDSEDYSDDASDDDGQDYSDDASDDDGEDYSDDASDDDSGGDGDGSRPASCLVRPFSFAGNLTGTGTAASQQPTVRLELPGLHEEPSVFQRWDDSAPSTSGLSTSLKRRREDSDPEDVSSKRQRFEETPETWVSSTSGLGSSASESLEENYWDSAPSTSTGLRDFPGGTFWLGHFARGRCADDSDSDSD